MQYEPGAKWSYTQSGINAAARIVEVVSGVSFDAFLQQRLFDPLGMKDTIGQHGVNYGLGTCILRTPHVGVAAMLPPGSFGHGGAWGTQAWIDPVRGMAYVIIGRFWSVGGRGGGRGGGFFALRHSSLRSFLATAAGLPLASAAR